MGRPHKGKFAFGLESPAYPRRETVLPLRLCQSTITIALKGLVQNPASVRFFIVPVPAAPKSASPHAAAGKCFDRNIYMFQ